MLCYYCAICLQCFDTVGWVSGLPRLNPDWFYLSGTGLPRLSWKRGRLMGVVVVVTVVFVTIVSTQCLTLLVEKQKEASIV